MRTESLEAAADWLRENGCLSEGLLRELVFVDNGYAVYVRIEQLVGGDAELLKSPRVVAIKMEAVEELTFRGDLSKHMVNNPKEIDWGLSEFALLELESSPEAPCRLRILWEDDRRLEIVSHRLSLDAGDP